VTLDVFGATRDTTNGLVAEIAQKLAEASRTPYGIELEYTPKGSTFTGTFFVLQGEITELPIDSKLVDGAEHVATVTLTMDCRPGMYGPRTLVATTTSGVTGPQQTVTVVGMAGDMPSDEAELIVTDTSGQNRRWVEWGAEYYHFDPDDPSTLLLDSDSLTTSGYAGTQTTLSGAYDPGSSGNSIISAVVGTSWQALASTGAQGHVGTFRVKARVNSGTGGCDAEFRLAWRVGDGQYETNTPVALDAGVQAYYELDLGTITIPVANSGTQSWEGRVDAKAASVDTLYLDYVKLVPAREGYGKARAAYIEQPGVIAAYDQFTGTSVGNDLNGRVAPAGGTWATSGDSIDYKFGDAGGERVYRDISSASVGRTALFGTGTYTNVEVSAAMEKNPYVGTLAFTSHYGLIARWVDANNYLRATATTVRDSSGTTTYKLRIVQVVGGTATTLAESANVGAWTTATMTLLVTEDGHAIAHLGNLAAVETTTSTLATSGTLATGRAGLYDYDDRASTGARYWDDVIISQVPAPRVVLYSGRTLEVRSATTERQSSGGGTYGKPNSYRGSRFLLHPAGSEGRATRVAVTAYRNDLDAGGAATDVSDALKLEVYARPRYSVAP
jgi:hypothetical protein